MRKKAIALLIAFLLLLAGARLTEAAAARVQNGGQKTGRAAFTIPDTPGYDSKAKGAVVIDAATGRVLFAKNAQQHLAMASTTKIMTTLLTLEQQNLDAYFTVDSAAIRVEGSSMGLREGDSVTLRTLCYGMLLPSGNDAANAAAVRIAGSKDSFAALMNARAAEIGLKDTHFVTPSGLDDDSHYSTAYDMALLAREALQNQDFVEICSQSSARIKFGNPPYDRWLSNHNRLLRMYNGVVGVKTGFTGDAGRCLVSAAERDGLRLVIVTLNCPDDWNEHIKLYNWCFSRFQPQVPDEKSFDIQVPVTGGIGTVVQASYTLPGPVGLLDGEQLKVVTTHSPFLYAPVKKGQVIGCVTIYSGFYPAGEVTLTAAETVEARPQKKQPLWKKLRTLF